jgi:tetratricopeptide (TPR) repeat protein
MNIRHKLEGDLVISLQIREDGFMDSLKIIEAQAKFIGEALLNGFNSLEQPCWKPSMQNGYPVSKSYLIVFRHRMNPDEEDDFLSEASQKIQEGKLKKAVKIYSKAIKKWPYYSKLYQIRSMVYEKMGKTEAAKKDLARYHKLKSTILKEHYITLNVFMF